MNEQPDSPTGLPSDPLNGLVAALLECGGVLSQVIDSMVQFQASGRGAPDAAPIPEVAHSLVRGVIGGVRKEHSKRDIVVATAIVAAVTDAVCDDLYVLGPDLN